MRVDFKEDFLDLTDREETLIEALLSVNELFTRESFIKRFTLRTHRITKIKRFAYYEKAIENVRTEGGFSKGLVILANEVEKLLKRKGKIQE